MQHGNSFSTALPDCSFRSGPVVSGPLRLNIFPRAYLPVRYLHEMAVEFGSDAVISIGLLDNSVPTFQCSFFLLRGYRIL